jgi:hypothetical protein
MKKTLILFTAFTISTACLNAQDSKPNPKPTTDTMVLVKDCVMMEDNKMMVIKSGRTSAMDSDMTMTNGTVVLTNGTIKTKDGQTMMLKNGYCVYMNGTLGKMKMHKTMPKM